MRYFFSLRIIRNANGTWAKIDQQVAAGEPLPRRRQRGWWRSAVRRKGARSFSLSGMCRDWLGAQSCAKSSAATEGVGTFSADAVPTVSLLLGGCGSPPAGLSSWRTGARWPPRWPLPTTTSTSSAGQSPPCFTTVSETYIIIFKQFNIVNWSSNFWV